MVDGLDFLFVSVDSQDGAHDVPDTFFPAPQYFARSTDKPINPILRIHAESDSEDEPKYDGRLEHATIIKAAMGRELAASFDTSRRNASMSKRVNDKWDQILGLDLM